MKKKDALYAEAEAVYRRFHAADEALARGDRNAEVRVRQLAVPEVADATIAHYRETALDGLGVRAGSFKIAWIQRVPTSSNESDIALGSCTDATSTITTQDGKDVGHGRILVKRVDFRRENGSLRVFRAGFKEVSSCQ
ncbi:hypothetical protein [Nigerium massiliense]|uniref:hypothetical protein n=1 Tax=Nigerium massiliense TaxID=1522317 RepID=UPI0011C985FD|nr:hypothetical protein [Nigerium massiliense]